MPSHHGPYQRADQVQRVSGSARGAGGNPATSRRRRGCLRRRRAELTTEVPRAYVVKTPGWGEGEEERAVAAGEIRRWSDKKLANHKGLRGGVVFVDSLPRTPSGKLLRRVLRDTKLDGKAKL